MYNPVNVSPARNRNIVDIISALFIILFLYTAVSKIITYDALTDVLKKYPLIGDMPILTAWVIPGVELITCVLLFVPRTRVAGLYASLILMIGFTLYLVYMLAFANKLPCTCGGVLAKLSWPQHLALNLLFVLFAITGIRLQKKRNHASR
jgi:hypothetical protein